MLLLLLLIISDVVFVVDGAIYIPKYNITYSSMSAMFGNKWPEDQSFVKAHLQLIPNRPLLCFSEEGEKGNIEETKEEDDDDDTTTTTTTTSNSSGQTVVTTPNDGLPVVLLAERGKCTFYEKATIASMFDPPVKYLIVYDNIIDNPGLVPMSSEFPSNMTLAFVSYHTGIDLREFILQNMRNTTSSSSQQQQGDEEYDTDVDDDYDDGSEAGGIIIEMNGIIPNPLPTIPELTLTGYMLAAMTGFLSFLLFFGCVLLCAQAGLISAHPDERGRIVLFGSDANGANSGSATTPQQVAMRILSNGLLTQQQVLSLDSEIFSTTTTTTKTNIPTNEEEEETEEILVAGEERLEQQHDICTSIADTVMSSCCSCAICLDEFEDNEIVRVLPCQHKFHDACLMPWLTERHSSCPLCKFDVLDYLIEKRLSSTIATKTTTRQQQRRRRRRRGVGSGSDDDHDDDELQEEEEEENLSAADDGDNDHDDNDINNNDNSNRSSLSNFWLHLRRFSGWTLLGEQDDIVINNNSTRRQPDDEENYDDTTMNSGEIEMENTSTRSSRTTSTLPPINI